MTKVVNLTKYKYDRNKAIDERIEYAERRIKELHLLIYSWKQLKTT
tara:strand:- start:4950 stop:5087 length:138 start_codon:yes stop_codon:yes gene_type:complete